MLDNPTSQMPSRRAKGQGDQALTVRHRKPRVLMASSVHSWNDVRIYFKEARSIASFAHVRLIAVQAPGSSAPPDGRICIDLLPANGLRPGDRKSIIPRLKRIGMILKSVLLQKYDVFHFHDPELLPAGWLAKLRGKKVIYDIHEDYTSHILEKYWITKLLRMPVSRVFSFVENIVARQLNFLLTAGPLLKERFEKINPKTEVIHNFPLSVEFVTRTRWDEKRNEVCFIGGITRIRGLLEVVQALEKVNSVTLNLAGSYSPIEFREELRGYQGWEKVREWGWLSRAMVAKVLGISKVGIVTFLSYPNHIDLRCNKMFEYMAAGIPVVASNFKTWRGVIEKYACGICVDPGNPEEIAEAINLLLRDGKTARTMGENGRQAVRSIFNWENEERKLARVYHSILNAHV